MKGQGSRKQNNKIKTNSNSSNKLCKSNESEHHRRLITYDDPSIISNLLFKYSASETLQLLQYVSMQTIQFNQAGQV